MAKRKSSSSFSKPLIQGGAAIVGGIAASFFDGIMPGQPMLTAGAKILGGGLAMMQKDDMVSGFGTGVLVNGGMQLIESILPAPAVGQPRTNYVANRQRARVPMR